MLKKIISGLLCFGLLAGCSSAPATSTEASASPEASTESGSTSEGIAVYQEKGLVIGLDDTFAPMGFRDENNELVGFDVELAQAVGDYLGIEITFQPIDWSMKETELNNGNIDAIWNGYSITEERKTQVAFSTPYLENRQIIVTLADSELATKADLDGQPVSVQKDSSALEAVQADTSVAPVLSEFDTNIDCFMDLEAGRSAAIVCDEVLARYVMKQRGETQYKVLDDNFGSEEYGIGLRLDDTALVEAINGALDALTKDGTYQSIYDKWFAE